MSDASKLTKSHRRRRIYIRYRIPGIREELKGLLDESRRIPEKVKTIRDVAQDPQALNRINHRRIYLGCRIEALLAEQNDLLGERKALAGEDLTTK